MQNCNESVKQWEGVKKKERQKSQTRWWLINRDGDRDTQTRRAFLTIHHYCLCLSAFCFHYLNFKEATALLSNEFNTLSLSLGFTVKWLILFGVNFNYFEAFEITGIDIRNLFVYGLNFSIMVTYFNSLLILSYSPKSKMMKGSVFIHLLKIKYFYFSQVWSCLVLLVSDR